MAARVECHLTNALRIPLEDGGARFPGGRNLRPGSGSPLQQRRAVAADPAEPLLGLGKADARWCFFGRDPGEQEVRLHRPVAGAPAMKSLPANR